MLSIKFGKSEESIEDIDAAFRRSFLDEWMTDSMVRDMIQDVDNSQVIDTYCIQSPVLGQIAPDKLSGGVKALVLMLKTDYEIWATACGDNCAKWILKIAGKKDLCINLEHYMMFDDMHFEFYNVNKGIMEEYYTSIMSEAKFV